MHRTHWFFAIASLFATAEASAQVPTFERDIRPIFEKRCNACHNARQKDDLNLSGGLALDSFDAVMAGVKGRKIVGANANVSELARRLVATDEDERMPLSDAPLGSKEQDLIRRWIDGGALRGTPVATAATTAPVRKPFRPTLDVTIPLDPKQFAAATGRKGTPPASAKVKVGPLPAVTAVTFAPGGQRLVLGTQLGVQVWDLKTFRMLRSIDNPIGPVHDLAVSPDGKLLAIGTGEPGRSGRARLLLLDDGSTFAEFDGHRDMVFGVAFRPDGKQLATASLDSQVKFWDLDTKRLAGTFKGHSDFVHAVGYASDGKSAYSCSKDKTVKRIDTKTFQEMRTFSDHNEDVLALAVLPQQKGVVSSGLEPALRIWKLDGDKPEKRANGHGGPVSELAVSQAGDVIASASGDKSVRLWDGSGKLVRTLTTPTEWQYAVTLSDDGQRVAAGGWDGIARVWEVKTGNLLASLMSPAPLAVDSQPWLAILPDGKVNAPKAVRSLARYLVANQEIPIDAPKPNETPKAAPKPAQKARAKTPR